MRARYIKQNKKNQHKTTHEANAAQNTYTCRTELNDEKVKIKMRTEKNDGKKWTMMQNYMHENWFNPTNWFS